jgi:acetyl esterase
MATNCIDERVEVDAVSMPVRIYSGTPAHGPAPIVLHLHGGAFVGGSLDTGRTISMLLADAGAIVVSADYPLAPAHPFPQALNAAFRVLTCLYANRTKWGDKKSSLFVAGEEAGGNLAAGLAMMARDQQAPPLAGQILLSPMLDPCMATCSIRRADAGPVGCRWADGWHQYLVSADKASHPYASPLGSSRLGGLAPALVLTAEDDPMRDECLTYARRLREAGNVVQEGVLPGPSFWPDALDRLDRFLGGERDWAPAVRDRFSKFFDLLLGSRRSAARAPRPVRK